MKKIKVFHILPDLGTGGAEKLALDICAFLDKENFETTVVSLFPSKNTIYEQLSSEKNIRIIFLNKQKGLDIKIFYQLFKLFKSEKPDIVHTHLYIFPYVFPTIIFNRIKGRVHTVHNIASKELRNSIKKIMKVAYRYFNITPVAISPYIKKTIIGEYRIKSEKVPCIYNGIDTSRFTSTPRNSHKKVVFVHVGRFSEQKNHNLLIESFALSLKGNPHMVLKLVGDGGLKPKIMKKVEELGIKDSVIFRGIQKDICSELNNSDVFVLSSDWEGLPISVLEAMACGLPIISTKSGGTRDVVLNGENGILVEIGDKIGLSNAFLKISNSSQLRAEMGNKSLTFSKNYDIRETSKQYANLYRKIMLLEDKTGGIKKLWKKP